MECMLARKWVASAHKRLLFVQWSLPPGPEHFDHSIDLFYQWVQSRNPLWLERGVFGCLALKGKKVKSDQTRIELRSAKISWLD